MFRRGSVISWEGELMEITKKLYVRMKEDFWLGMRVRLLREIRNGHSTFEKGKEMTIDRKWKGFGLVADEKRENGCIKSISRVSIHDIEFVGSQSTRETSSK